MKQPKCPWCGTSFRGDHVEGFRETGRCNSQWYPDFEGGNPDYRKQSEACREIVRLKIAYLRRMADSASIEAAWSRFCDGSRRSLDSMQRAWDRLDRFRSACLAKITELKELQCSTKS